MSYSIKQILSMYYEHDDQATSHTEDRRPSEPKTPVFRGEKQQLKKQIEELKSQNLILQKEYKQQLLKLTTKLKENQQIQAEVQQFKQQFQSELKLNQLLIENYLKKHENCFNLRQEKLHAKRLCSSMKDDIAKRITTCPSECSTLPSPSFVVSCSPKLIKINFRSFTKNYD